MPWIGGNIAATPHCELTQKSTLGSCCFVYKSSSPPYAHWNQYVYNARRQLFILIRTTSSLVERFCFPKLCNEILLDYYCLLTMARLTWYFNVSTSISTKIKTRSFVSHLLMKQHIPTVNISFKKNFVHASILALGTSNIEPGPG